MAFTLSTLQDQTIAARMVAFGEYVEDGTASAMKARDYKDATDLVAQTYSTPAIGHIVQDDVASTITKNTGAGGETQNPAYVAQPIAFNTRQDPDAWQGRTGPVDTHYGTQGVAVDCYNGALTGDVAATMGASGSPINSAGPQVMVAMQVRRLTPTECERLQGFPDGWTDIPWRGKLESPDGPRYKALGNSMAVPCMRYLGERINLVAQMQW